MKKSSKKKYSVNKKRLFVVIGGVLLLLLAVVLGIIYISKFVREEIVYSPYYEIEERTSKVVSTDVDGAKAYAWVRVQGTNIDTPVVVPNDAIDDDNAANYLWTSSNYYDGENRKVIYGHNIRNVSAYPEIGNSDHIRFEQLVSFAYYDFAKENLYIQYNDGKEDALYLIYAVSFNNHGDEFGQSYPKEEVANYIASARKNSVYDYDVDVRDSDELISLITCTRYFGAFEKTQFRVDARKLRKNEKIVKYNVETNTNYDIIK